MTPQQDAKELIEKFNEYTVLSTITYPNGKVVECFEDAKQCALISVDKAINIIESLGNGYYTLSEELKNKINYLLEVKQEIENF